MPIAILHNIRSVQNVGAIFRTADALGIEKIFLTGYTPAPIDRFGRIRQDFTKSALGAEHFVSWQLERDVISVIKNLKKEKFKIISIEQSKKSKDYKKIKAISKTCFIVGNEVDGLPESVLKLSDAVAQIPMKGKKESLNVSVAFGVAIFRILNV